MPFIETPHISSKIAKDISVRPDCIQPVFASSYMHHLPLQSPFKSYHPLSKLHFQSGSQKS